MGRSNTLWHFRFGRFSLEKLIKEQPDRRQSHVLELMIGIQAKTRSRNDIQREGSGVEDTTFSLSNVGCRC